LTGHACLSKEFRPVLAFMGSPCNATKPFLIMIAMVNRSIELARHCKWRIAPSLHTVHWVINWNSGHWWEAKRSPDCSNTGCG
ncbi:hypothetical protein ACFIQG_13670, partial [Comamonas odontotermitis]|uniref:hypothetical protein n=1 Tax=Comamonas odontotermitis TaxID=379895 RepID=UPI00366EDC5D